MDTFLFGGKKAGKRGLGAEGKACVVVAPSKTMWNIQIKTQVKM